MIQRGKEDSVNGAEPEAAQRGAALPALSTPCPAHLGLQAASLAAVQRGFQGNKLI
jgi:hypothetical protein